MNRGSIVFAADDGSEFSLPVNEDGSCGPMPRAGVPRRWEPPILPPLVKHIQMRDAQSAANLAEILQELGCDVTTHRSDR